MDILFIGFDIAHLSCLATCCPRGHWISISISKLQVAVLQRKVFFSPLYFHLLSCSYWVQLTEFGVPKMDIIATETCLIPDL